MNRLVALVWMGLLAAVFAGVNLGQAQVIDPKNANKPIEIEADDGIEWQQNARVYIARGHARARQGDVSLEADTLTAHYRQAQGQSAQIWQIVAEGSVRIRTASETATGERAVYDVDKRTFILTGRNVRLSTGANAAPGAKPTPSTQEASAGGQAAVQSGGRTLAAETITSTLAEDGKAISHVDAEGNVSLRTETDLVRGEKGAYDLKTRIAIISGAVKLTRGLNQMNGEYAVVDLNTGVSRLYAAAPGTAPGDKRVRGLLYPDTAPGAKPAGGAKITP